jgi:signal transduction histidine kinase/AmiR/NasT family two-component response regulator
MLQTIADRLGVELDTETQERVADDQLRMVWSHAAIGTLIATAFAGVMTVYFRGAVEPRLVYVWLAMKMLVAAPRVLQAQIFKRRGFPGGTAWRRATYGLLALDGAVWGLAGFWLMRADATTASLAIASFVGIACVATFGLQPSRLATAAYVMPIIVPMIGGTLMRADPLGLYCAISLSLLLMQMLLTASRSQAKLSEVFLLRIHSARISAEKAEALELVQRQSAVKSQFLGTVSHELRTPIHGMLGVARLVHVESRDALVKKRMELVEASGTHLLGLVTDLIDVSRMQSGQMRIQRLPFDLRREIERVADIYSMRASEKGLTFTLDSQIDRSTWVNGDPARLRQVLHNLLGNAIKFTQKGWVHLMVRLGSRPGDVHFEVRDTGIGISEEDQKLVFAAFQQVGPRMDGRRDGTGLGLTIAREIAELLGGGITLKSTPGFGSVFDFCVHLEPVASSAADDKRRQLTADGPDISARILLVEDNDVNALVAGAMLANQGHQVEHVSDGLEAVRRGLREVDRPALILMDCMMPTMDGFEATRSIRAQEAALGLPRIPIVALSAIIDEDTARQSLDAGMDDSLGKPFTSDQLRDVMRPWLALRESERQGALEGLVRNGSVDERKPRRAGPN